MNTPQYNPHGGVSLEVYDLLMNLFSHPQPELLWQSFSREQKRPLFKEVLQIFSQDNGAVTQVAAEAAGWTAREDIFRFVLSSLPELTCEEVGDDLEFFLAVNDYVGHPAVEKFLENELPAVFLRWGAEALRFSEKTLLEKEFYHLESEAYRLISALLFQLGAVAEYAAAVEELYLKILARWEWNHPLVNADAIEALSLRKSERALPLIRSCFAADLVDERILRFNHVKKNYGGLMPEGRPATQRAQDSEAPPPAYAGDERFGRLLAQVAHLDIDEVRLMTVARLVSPVMSRSAISELLADVLAQDTFSEADDESYEFYNGAEAERFVGQLMAFWNESTRYRQEFLPLEKTQVHSTAAFFNRAALFFGYFLDLVDGGQAKAFSSEQKAFLESFRKLHEEQREWTAGLFKQETPVPAGGYVHSGFEQRLQELWTEGYLGFVAGTGKSPR